MPLEVNPDSLREAAAVLALLPQDIDKAPNLGAEPVSKALKGSLVGTHLGGSDSVTTTAKDVLKARFNEFAALLAQSANTFHGTDQDAAQRLTTMGDLNNGDPHKPAPKPMPPGRPTGHNTGK